MFRLIKENLNCLPLLANADIFLEIISVFRQNELKKFNSIFYFSMMFNCYSHLLIDNKLLIPRISVLKSNDYIEEVIKIDSNISRYFLIL